ncbi:MAG: DUF1573 domain-containing protein [Crocinitomicaceae bacterium]
MKKTIYAFALMTIVSCGKKEDGNGQKISKKEGAVTSNVEANDKDLEKIVKDAPKVSAPTITITSMSFDQMEHDFGTVTEESVSDYSFKVTNTGSQPLIIDDVSASCGCTTPKKPEKPIAPGQSDEIQVSFKPNVGQLGEQNKTVTVKANTNPDLVVLKIKANVKKKKK